MESMKIHGMCIVKDEADVIAECLTAAAEWCDHIYIFDNGSSDETWAIAQELAARLPSVVAWKTDPAPFSDGLRAEIFHQFRAGSRPGDWWCRLDADEFYIDDPRVFLRKVPEDLDVVWTASFSYYFTDKDAELYKEDPSRYADDVPVEERLRYYVNHWGEPRFFRYRDQLQWTQGGGFPDGVDTAPAYPVRIWLKHFPYRSPQQISKRLAARSESLARGVFEHEAIADWGNAVGAVRTTRALMDKTGVEFATLRWEDRVVPSASLDYDAHDQRLAVNESLMPKLPAAPSGGLASRVARGLLRRARQLLHRG
jgi:hypothetical protein